MCVCVCVCVFVFVYLLYVPGGGVRGQETFGRNKIPQHPFPHGKLGSEWCTSQEVALGESRLNGPSLQPTFSGS